MTCRSIIRSTVSGLLLLYVVGCSSDGSRGTEADRRGVGASCAQPTDCTEAGQSCLPFKGGYCGIADCTRDADCPTGSACVQHDDGRNYCFLVCVEKVDCNVNRPAELESNCSSNVTFVSGNKAIKACVPPSG
ncbi:MAG TPA: hypothetical protein VFQ35_23465 [Polyangiaceae bacterium]|nr:hypothetical protein [Polyangiaceae bacterium]